VPQIRLPDSLGSPATVESSLLKLVGVKRSWQYVSRVVAVATTMLTTGWQLESQIKRLTLQLRSPTTSEELETAQKDKQQLEELLLQTQK
jgi:hypothetical protein